MKRAGTAPGGEPSAADEAAADPARDSALLDALYQDDAPAAEPAEEDELARLRQLRVVFAELRAYQDEPPPAGMALLMAAARQAASERKPAGLWARLQAGWRALALHPGMAAAAAGVLVIGASGYLMSRGMGKHADSTYSAAAEERSGNAAAPAADSPPPAAGLEAAAPAAAPVSPDESQADRKQGAASAASAGEGTSTEPADVAPRRSRKPDALSKNRLSEETKAEASVKDDTGKKRSRPEALQMATDGEAVGDQRGGGGAARGANELPKPVVVPTGKPAPAPPPPPAQQAPAGPPAQRAPASPSAPPSEERTATDEDESVDAAAGRDTATSTLARSSERWFSLARTAAAQGKCDEVRLLATRVRSEDPAFYSSRFLNDPAIKKCL